MKAKTLFAGILAVIGIVSCNTEAAETKKNISTMKEEHKHDYGCPMHPEVKGKEGEPCPKCGMTLEEVKALDKASYFMKFTKSVNPVKPNQNVTLSFVPKQHGSENENVSLEVEHEKRIHLIVVSEDLSWFNHIHPDMNKAGEYTVNTSFPYPGNYTLFADYKPVGAGHVVDKLHVNVEGTAPLPKLYSQEKLTGSSGQYSFTLQPVQMAVVAGATNHIYGIIKKDGKQIDVNSLEDYLGAKAHIVIVSVADKEYLHVHPMVKEGKLAIHADFTKPGMYRGWIQFRDKQQLHTMDLTLKVVAGREVSGKQSADAHSNHAH